MKSVLLLLAVVLVIVSADKLTVQKIAFQALKKQFDRHYSTKAEEAMRFEAYQVNFERAAELQKRNPNATFNGTPFFDRTQDEIRRMLMTAGLNDKRPALREVRPIQTHSPSPAYNVNWVKKGAVTPVPNQGSCGGGCVAYAVLGNIESLWYLAGHPLTPLSAEELLACGAIEAMCCGGMPSQTYDWIVTAHHGEIVTAAAYPFNSSNGNDPETCEWNAKMEVGAVITGFVRLTQDMHLSEDELADYVVRNGPVEVEVNAMEWFLYTGGVFSNCSNGQVDHTALVVGVDTVANPPYWILRNSWGTNWGEEGYIRLLYGVNTCNVAYNAATAIVKK